MKKIKKLVACLSAAAIAMTVGVSAFAATATYEDGFVKVADAPIDAEHQWTVVVIAADKADATLTAEDLYYINQGTSGEAFWTNGMGTKTELTDGEYIVRIGGETITDPGELIEIKFTVSTSSTGNITFIWGDVTYDNSITGQDLNAIIAYLLGTANTYGEYTVGQAIPGTDIIWGDVTNADGITGQDLNAIIAYLLGTANTYGEYTVGQEATIPTSK